MNTRKLMLLAALALMSSAAFLNDLHAAPQKRRVDSPMYITVVAPALQPAPKIEPPGVVVVPSTGKSLKQPDVTLFRSVVLLQKLGTLLEKPPQR